MEHYPFPLKPLPYSYDALEPYLDARTLHFHHDKHLQTYVDNLNKALAPYPDFHDWGLEQLLLNLDALPVGIRMAVIRNGGGVYAHQSYFDGMAGYQEENPPLLANAIVAEFGSFDNWKSQMKQEAISVFGSGWTWLVFKDGKLKIVSTANQDTPLPAAPVLLVDVWEHAYYLMYQNRRADYVDNWFKLIDWEMAANRYARALAAGA